MKTSALCAAILCASTAIADQLACPRAQLSSAIRAAKLNVAAVQSLAAELNQRSTTTVDEACRVDQEEMRLCEFGREPQRVLKLLARRRKLARPKQCDA